MNARNVVTKCQLITKSSTKRATAAAIASAQARNDWSNSDAAAALDCCEGTIRNRLDGDDPHHQMTVHELRRSLQSDGTAIANSILHDQGFKVVPLETVRDETCDRKKSSTITRAQLAVSEMLEDQEISDEEIRQRRAELEAGRDAFDALLSRIVKPRAVSA